MRELENRSSADLAAVDIDIALVDFLPEKMYPLLTVKAEVIRVPGGHHFDNDYGALARRILDGFRRRAG